MGIGAKIRKLRKELNLKQIELAEMAGLTKQNLYKYENEIITNIPSDKIELLARILNTTPAYLMGWGEEETDVEENEEFVLSDEEKELIRNYRNLHPVAKQFAFNSIAAQATPIVQSKEALEWSKKEEEKADEIIRKYEQQVLRAQSELAK